MKALTLEDGAAILATLAAELIKGRGPFSRDYAGAILEAAVRNAAGRPTPQAPMVAERMRLVGARDAARIIGPPSKKTHTGARMGKVAFGAEFGSDAFRQFGPRRPEGQWLHPAANTPDPATERVASDFLTGLLKRVIP
jgi:hypothetical protein